MGVRVHEPRGLHVPAGHIVQIPHAGMTEHLFDFLLLRGRGRAGAGKRRIAHNVVQLPVGHQGLPIESQGIAAHNGGAGTQGNAGKIPPEMPPHLDIHLVVHKPHGHLRNLRRKFLDFDSVELLHTHPAEL